MSYIITKKCINCGFCEAKCPMFDAITSTGVARIINKELCVVCGSCVKVCPADAIEKERIGDVD